MAGEGLGCQLLDAVRVSIQRMSDDVLFHWLMDKVYA